MNTPTHIRAVKIAPGIYAYVLTYNDATRSPELTFNQTVQVLRDAGQRDPEFFIWLAEDFSELRSHRLQEPRLC